MATKKSSNPLTAMSAGCIAGTVEATVVWPMEFIKTQLQLGSKSSSKLPYTGMIQGLSYTVRTTGFLSLYRGLSPTLIGSFPKAGIRFGLNSVIKEKLRDKNGKLSVGTNFVAGLGAGVTEALLIVAPVETVKTKVIELNMPFREGLSYIIRTEGFGGIYKGAIATAMKQGSNSGLRFMWFNEYKNQVTKDGEISFTPIMGLLGGMSAGCFSTLGNNPFDVVKTRMQGTQAARYKNTFDCFRKILRNEGVGAFYVGLAPRLGRVVPGQGIIFMSFESIQSSLERNFDIFKT